MFRILVMNGLLINLILIWTSAAKEPSAGTLINSSAEHPTEPLNYSMKETNMEIRSRKTLCSRELGGRCVSKKKSCPSNLPFQKSPGKPYCSKKNHCCYPGSIIEIEGLLFQKSEKDDDVNWNAIRNACVKGNNHKIYEQVTIDICKEKCIEEDEINCQSIEYSSAQQMCAISEVRSDSDDFIEPCFVDGWIFAEIELNTVSDKCIDVKGQKRCEYLEKNFKYCNQGKYIDYMAFFCKNTCLKCEEKCIDVKGQKRCEYWENNFKYCSQGKYIDYMAIYCTKTCLKCQDNKQCEVNNGGCHHICTHTIGSYICSCQEGFTLGGDGKACIGSICELEKITSQKISSAPTSMSRMPGSCDLRWNANNGNGPLIIKKNSNEILTNRAPMHSSIYITCPGNGNLFDKWSRAVIELKCKKDGKLYFDNFSSKKPQELKFFSCHKRIKASVEETSQVPECSGKDEKKHRIGFKLNPEKTQCISKFIKLIDICFDNKLKTTRWTSHTIRGQYFKDKPNYCKGPEFDIDGISVFDEKIYEKTSQYELFKTKLGLTDILCREGKETHIVRGHMSPKSDFITKAEQDATFFYMNVQPQWQVINNGNWRLIEEKIQKNAESLKRDIKVTTGGMDTLILKSNWLSTKTDMYLGGATEVPIPAVTWKVMFDTVLNDGVAFVVVNNPITDTWVRPSSNTKPSIPFTTMCAIDCGTIDWLRDGKSREELNSLLQERLRGTTYCCDLAGFKNLYCPNGGCPS